MKRLSTRFLAVAAAAVLGAAALCACGSSESSAKGTIDSAAAAEKQSSIAAKVKENAPEAGTSVEEYLGKVIDLSAYTDNNGVFTPKEKSDVTLQKAVKYASGNTFSLGDAYQKLLDKGYSSDRDGEELQAHSISVNMETKNSKGEAIALTMRNTSGQKKSVKECPVVTLKYDRGAERTCESFTYMGVTPDSSLKETVAALGKNPAGIQKSEQKGMAVLTYYDQANNLNVEIVFNIKEEKLKSFRISQA